MKNQDFMLRMEDENPKALYADGFDDAIIGMARRCGQPTLVVYDADKIIDVLMQRDGLSWEEAQEHYEFNIVGGWHGEHTPLFFESIDKE